MFTIFTTPLSWLIVAKLLEWFISLLYWLIGRLLVLLDVLLESVSALDEEPLFTRDKEYQVHQELVERINWIDVFFYLKWLNQIVSGLFLNCSDCLIYRFCIDWLIDISRTLWKEDRGSSHSFSQSRRRSSLRDRRRFTHCQKKICPQTAVKIIGLRKPTLIYVVLMLFIIIDNV